MELRHQVAKNLVYYRKAHKLTQGELAKKLNYSDKAISKWERGESLPDVFVLMTLAELFGVTLNDITASTPSTPKRTKIKIRTLIASLSIGLVWLIATFAFFLILIIEPTIPKIWLSFIYAIPVSGIVAIVFCCLWGNTLSKVLSISLFAWSIPLAICLTVSFERLWGLFIVIIPFQILILLWFHLNDNIKRNKELKKQE